MLTLLHLILRSEWLLCATSSNIKKSFFSHNVFFLKDAQNKHDNWNGDTLLFQGSKKLLFMSFMCRIFQSGLQNHDVM
jgi:hypothetical protein